MSRYNKSAGGNNTYVFDTESVAEMTRLMSQDRMTTEAMNGPLSGVTNEEIFNLHNILDLACGPGGWILDVAYELPDASVAGVDISKTMIEYANARAQSQVLINASFEVMDITQPLDFADSTFDLLNARFLVGVLKREAWAPFLAECARVLHPGGTIRITECDTGGITTSPAYEQLCAYLFQAMWHLGYGFSPDGRTMGMTPMLGRLIQQTEGFHHIRYQASALDFSANTNAWADMYRNAEVAFLQAKPLLISTRVITPETFDTLYTQMLIERQLDTFCGMGYLLTTTAIKR